MIIFTKTFLFPPDSADISQFLANAPVSCVHGPSIIRSDLNYFDKMTQEIINVCNANISKELRDTAAFVCFECFGLREVLKNARDSGSTKVTIVFELSTDHFKISCSDDGNAGKLPSTPQNYSWVQALLTQSEKIDQLNKNGGKHLGLAICAHFLGNQCGTVYLGKNIIEKGVTVIFSSPKKPSSQDTVSEEGENYRIKMILELLCNVRDYEALLTCFFGNPPAEIKKEKNDFYREKLYFYFDLPTDFEKPVTPVTSFDFPCTKYPNFFPVASDDDDMDASIDLIIKNSP